MSRLRGKLSSLVHTSSSLHIVSRSLLRCFLDKPAVVQHAGHALGHRVSCSPALASREPLADFPSSPQPAHRRCRATSFRRSFSCAEGQARRCRSSRAFDECRASTPRHQGGGAGRGFAAPGSRSHRRGAGAGQRRGRERRSPLARNSFGAAVRASPLALDDSSDAFSLSCSRSARASTVLSYAEEVVVDDEDDEDFASVGPTDEEDDDAESSDPEASPRRVKREQSSPLHVKRQPRSVPVTSDLLVLL